jgi:hypothetical protein
MALKSHSIIYSALYLNLNRSTGFADEPDTHWPASLLAKPEFYIDA